MIAGIAMGTTADKIKMLRQSHGLTQEDLVAKAGLSLATVQRAERGDQLSAGSLASLAAALDVPANDLADAPSANFEPYLPLDPITTGRQLFALLWSVSDLDFGFCELDNLADAQAIEHLYDFAMPIARADDTLSPIAQVTRELEAKALLEQLLARGFRVAGGSFAITAYEVDDDGMGLAILHAEWNEERAALRVGRSIDEISRAHILGALGKYETVRGDAVVFPPIVSNEDDSANSRSEPPSQGKLKD